YHPTFSSPHYIGYCQLALSLILGDPPTPVLSTFPYTTLFRSPRLPAGQRRFDENLLCRAQAGRLRHQNPGRSGVAIFLLALGTRSEEHTSELQSRENLVCRLLLEKKKNIE